MPLTTVLKDKDHWMPLFLARRFGNLRHFVAKVRGEVKSLEMLVPLRPENRPMAWTVGKAVDFCLRLHLGMRPVECTALQRGVAGSPLMLDMPGPPGRACQRSLAALLEAPLAGDHEDMARVGVVLSWVDDLYRGNRPAVGMRSLVDGLIAGGRPVWEENTGSVEDHLAEEVAALVAIAKSRFPASDARDVVHGPEFAGSDAVDGADADLVVSGCLYDVKTTINPRDRLAASVRQLLSYVLLDWDDAYGLQQAGFYFARQGGRMAWSLDEVVNDVTGDNGLTLGDLRTELRAVAKAVPAL